MEKMSLFMYYNRFIYRKEWYTVTMSLMNRIADGDREALGQLYESYKTKVFRVALSILGDCFLAEDAVQETFIKIQQNAGSLRLRDNENGWIMTIARNTAIDILRKHRREVVHEKVAEMVDRMETDGDMVEYGQGDGYLQLIDPLEELDRQIVSLHLIGECKHRETARILGMNVSAVKKRYERAIRKIAREMEEKS